MNESLSDTKLLHDVLPIDEKHSQATVRNHLLRVAERSEKAMGDERPVFIEGCQAERDRLPIPDGPLSVGLDGGIVRARRKKRTENKSDQSAQSNVKKSTQTDQTTPIAKTANLFEVIAGKSILSFRRDDPEDAPPSSKCFAMVQTFDKKPKRRLFDLLQSQGMQANQDVTFFSDGGDNVRRIPEFLNPDSEHILDWFHITMRLTVLNQCARGLPKSKKAEAEGTSADKTSVERGLESVKHYLWHGNTGMALTRLADVEGILENWGCDATSDAGTGSAAEGNTELNEDASMPIDTGDIDPELALLPPLPVPIPSTPPFSDIPTTMTSPSSDLPQLPRSARFDGTNGTNGDSASRMLRYVRELDTYIDNNARFIVNYGERYRSGERISTGFVESTINQVVSKRLVKKQQMQWTPKGAHLLLQVRTQVLNEDWEGTFRKWYPGFRPENSAISTPALAA